MVSQRYSSVLYHLLAYTSLVLAAPNDGPQYYTDSVVVSGGSSYTERVPATATPIYVSSTYSASTETFRSTSATTLYETFTSFATYESASTTTSYPTCSGTITVTTSIMIPYDYFRTIGTSFISAKVYQTVYISGESRTTDLATTTTTYYVPGPPDTVVTTAPTDIHTAPFSLTFPCATTTVTQTLSYEPAIVTLVQLRNTIATTYSSSESYYTVSSTSYSTETEVSTILVPYPTTTSGSSIGSSTTSMDVVIFPKTSSVYVTSVDVDVSATTATYHITAGEGVTTTSLVLPTGNAGSQTVAPVSTFTTIVSSPEISSVIGSGTTQGVSTTSGTAAPPAATGAGSKTSASLEFTSCLVILGSIAVLLI